MRVLWVDLVSEPGGAQMSMLEACVGLAARGVEVVAAVPPGFLSERLKQAGITVYPVSRLRAHKRGFGFFVTAAKLLRAPATVSQILKVVKPDIIHANSLTAFMAAKGTHTQIPIVWHVRDLRQPLTAAIEAGKKAEMIVAVSEAVDEWLADILSPRVLGRIKVIRNGVDWRRFASASRDAARIRLGMPEDVPVIGMVAHLTPWKRHDAFIGAAALIRDSLPGARFVIVGRDLFNEHAAWVAELERAVEQAGLSDSLKWVQDCDDISEVLAAFDLLLHPALNEPFGRVVCEAMASGVPVVAAESGGPSHIIENNVSGILVRGGDVRKMADAAVKLLREPAVAERLVACGKTRVRDKFSSERVCDLLAAAYKDLLLAAAYHPDEH
ncbi:MAG: glycosyltransferase family 4 protein [Kiritimatiellae bacterium]|nr:glycosyltransferase family 4 protein [Kiritimatiellia bacterium]